MGILYHGHTMGSTMGILYHATALGHTAGAGISLGMPAGITQNLNSVTQQGITENNSWVIR